MKLSELQQYILTHTYLHNGRCPRAVFDSFYAQRSDSTYKAITVSMERLIAKGLLKGYGYKTAEKFFIEKVVLTSSGKKRAVALIQDRSRLPFSLPHAQKPKARKRSTK